jgi:hypothetical protein
VVLQFEDDGTTTTVVVPRAVVVSLADVLLNRAQGQAVSIIPAHAILTTQQDRADDERRLGARSRR